MPQRFDIAMQRNEDWAASITLTDDVGAPIDLTDWDFSLSVKSKIDNIAIIQNGTVDVTDPTGGEITIEIDGPGHALGTYGDPLLTYHLPYDLIGTDSGGLSKAYLSGYVILSRGVSAP